MDVWGVEIGVVHGANADEPDSRASLRVVAPNRNSAGWTAGNLLASAARRGRQDNFGLTSSVHNVIGFIESVERMCGPGLALAPTAMAGMNNQWCSDQTISDLSARASAFHVRLPHAQVMSILTPRTEHAGTNAQYCGFALRLRTYGGPGMAGSEEVVVTYRLHAAHCTEIAKHTSDPKNRLILLRMTAAWLTLTEQADKNSLVYKTPEPFQSQQQSGAEVSKKQA